jgi:hypothetical protein
METIQSVREHIRERVFGLCEQEIDLAAVRFLAKSSDPVVRQWMVTVIRGELVMKLREQIRWYGLEFDYFDLVEAHVCPHKLLFSVEPEMWQKLMQDLYDTLDAVPLEFVVCDEYILTFTLKALE